MVTAHHNSTSVAVTAPSSLISKPSPTYHKSSSYPLQNTSHHHLNKSPIARGSASLPLKTEAIPLHLVKNEPHPLHTLPQLPSSSPNSLPPPLAYSASQVHAVMELHDENGTILPPFAHDPDSTTATSAPSQNPDHSTHNDNDHAPEQQSTDHPHHQHQQDHHPDQQAAQQPTHSDHHPSTSEPQSATDHHHHHHHQPEQGATEPPVDNIHHDVPLPDSQHTTADSVAQPDDSAQSVGDATDPSAKPVISADPQQVVVPTAVTIKRQPSVAPPIAPAAHPRHITPPVVKKAPRMPGTKQCPSCQNTIAAAVAKCPKCPHVFREKKEKVKRSGKRGKKNCPKCNFENPSACSSCKQCKHVFRLKLMDKYKAMRPRQPSESVAAAAAAAAHAAANMHGQHTAVTAVSTVPMPAAVPGYPTQLSQAMHPQHGMTVIQPVGQHSMALQPGGHTLHPGTMPQIHQMPPHAMQHHHQSHPPL